MQNEDHKIEDYVRQALEKSIPIVAGFASEELIEKRKYGNDSRDVLRRKLNNLAPRCTNAKQWIMQTDAETIGQLVIDEVSLAYDVRLVDLTGVTRSQSVARARYTAFSIFKTVGWSTSQISRFFRCSEHVVLFGQRRFTEIGEEVDNKIAAHILSKVTPIRVAYMLDRLDGRLVKPIDEFNGLFSGYKALHHALLKHAELLTKRHSKTHMLQRSADTVLCALLSHYGWSLYQISQFRGVSPEGADLYLDRFKNDGDKAQHKLFDAVVNQIETLRAKRVAA